MGWLSSLPMTTPNLGLVNEKAIPTNQGRRTVDDQYIMMDD
jgi:hypothetical protein